MKTKKCKWIKLCENKLMDQNLKIKKMKEVNTNNNNWGFMSTHKSYTNNHKCFLLILDKSM